MTTPELRSELEAIPFAAASGDGGGWTALVERFTARVRRAARLRQLSSHDVDAGPDIGFRESGC
jgi:hypothetical protein